MENRIQIGGVWYIREDLIPQSTMSQCVIENVEDLCMQYNGMMYEDDVMILDASRIASNDTVSSIAYTDKTNKPWKEEYFDNENWFLGILENDSEAMEDFEETFKTEYQRQVFKAFLLKLRAMGWL